MVLNTRDRNIDSSRREDARKGTVDRCEVIEVHPHVDPFDGGAGDRDFNVVDVQLIDRPRDSSGAAPLVKRTRINCLQHYHGCVQGDPWTPRIGDMVLIYWIKEREGLVIGTIPSVQQEPICRSEATSEHQEIVCKRAPWEQPGMNQDGNYVVFPLPKHPDCFKWWPITRDYITIHDCPYGHNRAQCDKKAPCTCLDDLQSGTWWKVFSDISPTIYDKPRRVKFHHHCGSYYFFDEDGTVHLENRVAENPRAHITLYPNASVVIRSADDDPELQRGAYIYLAGYQGEEPGKIIIENSETHAQAVFDTDGSIELKHSLTSLKISNSGAIIQTSPTEINLNAPAIYQNGTQIHPNASEGWAE